LSIYCTRYRVRYHTRYRLQYRYWCTAGAQGSCPSYQPHESDDDPSDHGMDANDMHDYLDHDPGEPPISTANLGPYACFLADMSDCSDMSQADDYIKASEAFPLPLPCPAPPGLSIH
jgi:hypothetical protein